MARTGTKLYIEAYDSSGFQILGTLRWTRYNTIVL